jgi:hypothetical protein
MGDPVTLAPLRGEGKMDSLAPAGIAAALPGVQG